MKQLEVVPGLDHASVSVLSENSASLLSISVISASFRYANNVNQCHVAYSTYSRSSPTLLFCCVQ